MGFLNVRNLQNKTLEMISFTILVGGFLPTHLKNKRPSNLIIYPQKIGVNIKDVGNNHLAMKL